MDRTFHYEHAPATFAFSDRDLVLQAILPDEGGDLIPLTLLYSTEGDSPINGRIRMLPVDGFSNGEGYSIYAGTVPASSLQRADALSYYFVCGDEKGENYRIPLLPSPKLPPFIVTEYFPWGGGPVQCMEIYNPGASAVDLYDYEWALLDAQGEIVKRDPLAEQPGVNVLQPDELAVLYFLDSAIHRELGENAQPQEAILAYLAAQYPESCGDIAERGIRLLPVETAQLHENGEWHTVEGRFALYHWLNPRICCVVARGGAAADAVYRISINPDKEHLQVRKFRASLWTVDPRYPHTAICTHSRVLPTPGFTDNHQFIPRFHAVTVPAILPLEPQGRVRLSKGSCSVQFAVAGKEIALPTVYVKDGEGFVPYAAQINTDGVYEAVIPAEKMRCIPGHFTYYIRVSGGLYTASYGTAQCPHSVRIVDDAGPAVLQVYPARGQVLELESYPEICLRYYDIAGVNTRTSIFCVDGRNVSKMARWEEGRVCYRPDRPLALGEHSIEVSLRDALGNRTYYKSTFTVGDGEELNCYRGEIHAHTLESDGMGTPAQAMTYARDVGAVDYFAVTDHSHYLTLDELRAQRATADSFNHNGTFTTLHGFEMTWNFTTGYWGHMNVLNVDWLTPNHADVDLPHFYRCLIEDPNAIGMFNHPEDAWGDFNEFDGWNPEIDRKMCLAEIRGAWYDRGYSLMLSKGWHASPVSNEDNHAENWTTATTSTGYVLAPALTRENLLEAIRLRRTYSTYDNTMQIRYRVNGAWLGARLQAPEQLIAEIEIHTESENGIGTLALVSEDNIVVARVDAGPLCDFSWRVELDPDFDYYYLRITNGNIYSVTSPVFVEGRDLLNVKSLSYGVCAEDEIMPHVVEATVQNESDKSMKDVSVDFYLTPLSGFELRTLTPFASVRVGKLEAGEVCTVAQCFPTVAGHRRVTAVVHGMQGKERYADTTYRLLTPIRISKQVPLTASVAVGEEEIKNPFAYVELYNPLPTALSLDKYSLRLWHASGVAPLPERTLKLDGYTVPAGGTLTIWVRPVQAPLTVADFNAHYGTALIEGEGLIITEQRITSGSAHGRRMDLLLGKEVVTRITFGRYCTTESDVREEEPLLYADLAKMSQRQCKLVLPQGTVLPHPGETAVQQIPPPKRAAANRTRTRTSRTDTAKKQIVTRLAKAPLLPLQMAKLVFTTAAALKHIFSAKE